MKPIETVYAGVTFRSRLEARWAMFLQELGFVPNVTLLYEPEGYEFDVDGERYLPDFFVVPLQTFLEIKPVEPSEAERRKCARLANSHERRVACFFGHPGTWLAANSDGEPWMRSGLVWNGDGDIYPADDSHWFCACPRCGDVGIAYRGRGARVCRKGCWTKPLDESVDRVQTHDRHAIQNAAHKANSHRFWNPEAA